jgi:hypothetical protein
MATFADLPAEIVARVCRAVLRDANSSKMRTYGALLGALGACPVADKALADYCAAHHAEALSACCQQLLQFPNFRLFDVPQFFHPQKLTETRAWALELVFCMAKGLGVVVCVRVLGAIVFEMNRYYPRRRSKNGVLSLYWCVYDQYVSLLKQVPVGLLEWLCTEILEYGHTNHTLYIQPIAFIDQLRPVVASVAESTWRETFRNHLILRVIGYVSVDDNYEFAMAAVSFSRANFLRLVRLGASTVVPVTHQISLAVLHASAAGKYTVETLPFPRWVGMMSRRRYAAFVERILA